MSGLGLVTQGFICPIQSPSPGVGAKVVDSIALNVKTYTVTRQVEGSYVDGVYTPGGISNFTVDASVQPISGMELENLPEGQHAENTRVLYTTTAELFPRNPTNEADEIAIDGEDWEVFNVETWFAFGCTHYKCLIARKNTP